MNTILYNLSDFIHIVIIINRMSSQQAAVQKSQIGPTALYKQAAWIVIIGHPDYTRPPDNYSLLITNY